MPEVLAVAEPPVPAVDDLRDLLFAGIRARVVTAAVVADDGGTIAEVDVAVAIAADLGLTVTDAVRPGGQVQRGDVVLRVVGRPKQIALGEERLVGVMAKASGIATAAGRFVERAGPGLRVVAGAWKKVPPSLKAPVRRAVAVGGAGVRVCEPPFVYLDKNFVTMLGGVRAALEAAALPRHRRVVQLGGVSSSSASSIAADACEAAACGADVVFVDTGRPADVRAAAAALRDAGLRARVELAFGGNVRLADVDLLRRLDLDVVDVGRAIVDAPLLDMHLEVVEVAGP